MSIRIPEWWRKIRWDHTKAAGEIMWFKIEEESMEIQGGNPETSIQTLDDIGPGGAHHSYGALGPHGEAIGVVKFQRGPVLEPGAGYNGFFDEDLVAILIHRLEHFQAGPFACEQNAHTLMHLQNAARSMRKRQEDRVARGVEGTSEP